ncbi:NADH-quinone oxidoreductase subunit N [Weeksella virosa]|uniref:NADH-quinone oxidoreductase subunit N n=1 Tax=Weeksella virosa TaxID=1014 RepID=UPI002555F35C|nr:NADH-quinone oxidoreductase subunit N [Weeksella virosa]MDK7375295.1 NADH-quinone oxidoreductase subunit N [Weeksella virosa]
MNIIILSALSGIVFMFSGFYIKNHKALNLLSIILLLGMVIGGICQLAGYEILADRYNNMIKPSPYGVIFFCVLAGLAILYMLINRNEFHKVGKHLGEYYALIFFSFVGISVLAQFANLITMFLAIELLSIPMYLIAGTAKNSLKSTEASVKYFLMGAFSTGILLLGMSFVYGSTGTFLIQNIQTFLPELQNLYYIGWVLIFTSFCFKVGAAPFQFWVPDVYAGTPTVFTTYMATIVKGGSFLGFILIMQSFPFNEENYVYFRYLLTVIIFLTLFIGNYGALNQRSVKKMMAYSSIAQAGFMLFVLFNINWVAKEALMYYTISYSLASFIIFYAINNMGKGNYADFAGLGKANPILAFSVTIALISLAGIPLTAGFIAKFMTLSIGAMDENNLAIIILGLIMAVIGMFYYFKVIVQMYFQRGNPKHKQQDGMTNFLLLTSVILIIVLGIIPDLLTRCLNTPMW